MRASEWDLIRGGHYGQRPRVPHLKAEHMAAPTNAANVKKVLANSEPSTHGTFWHFASIRTDAVSGRYRRHSGHCSVLALNGSVANDPKRTWENGGFSGPEQCAHIPSGQGFYRRFVRADER
jgi:hypothetical protein